MYTLSHYYLFLQSFPSSYTSLGKTVHFFIQFKQFLCIFSCVPSFILSFFTNILSFLSASSRLFINVFTKLYLPSCSIQGLRYTLVVQFFFQLMYILCHYHFFQSVPSFTFFNLFFYIYRVPAKDKHKQVEKNYPTCRQTL